MPLFMDVHEVEGVGLGGRVVAPRSDHPADVQAVGAAGPDRGPLADGREPLQPAGRPLVVLLVREPDGVVEVDGHP